jgi:hypothetical protein
MAAELGPTRPYHRRTIWPVEGDRFGIDVRRGGGATGNGRATVVARPLEGAASAVA